MKTHSEIPMRNDTAKNIREIRKSLRQRNEENEQMFFDMLLYVGVFSILGLGVFLTLTVGNQRFGW